MIDKIKYKVPKRHSKQLRWFGLFLLVCGLIAAVVVMCDDAWAGNYYHYITQDSTNQGVAYDSMIVTFWLAGTGTVDSNLYTTFPVADSTALDSSKGYQKKTQVSYSGLDGLSFVMWDWIPPLLVSASASVDYTAMDSALTSTHGSGSWTTGGAGTNTFAHTLYIGKSTDSTPVNNAVIQVWDTAQSGMEWSGISGANGQAIGTADAGTWLVIIQGAGINGETDTVTVAGIQTDSVFVVSHSVTAPSGANACRVWGYFYGAGGSPTYQDRLVRFILSGPARDTCNNANVPDDPNEVYTDSTGYFEVELIWSSCLEGKTYRVELEGADATVEAYTVPDSTTAQLIWTN